MQTVRNTVSKWILDGLAEPWYVFRMLAESDIERMNTVERLQAIELLWTSIARSSASVSSPVWHGEVLAARKTRVDAGEGSFLTIAELRSRLHGGESGPR